VNVVMNFRVPQNVAWFLSGCTSDGLRSMELVPILQPIIIPGSIEFLEELHSLTIS
jgi:hypothetical protein